MATGGDIFSSLNDNMTIIVGNVITADSHYREHVWDLVMPFHISDVPYLISMGT